ncbi:Uncharacterised protein [Legionella wadsworthii]|uniref:Uncharacterized protein n=1 Tax=Legionella wadsworthii TaxID=28088 RepID=A0A378LRC7_9GAMM|nr:hypothetical protein [Legionella wadsworthii]STY29495.1 Uncharacterised protein [Legionella wadsworthii]
MKRVYRLGFWSETRDDSVRQIQNLPNIIANSCLTIAPLKSVDANDSIGKKIYSIILPALQVNTETASLQITGLQYAKIAELTVNSKKSSQAGLIDLDLYFISYSGDIHKEINYFFLIDKNNEVAGYTHFSYLESSPHLVEAYSNLGFVTIDSIESYRKDYPLGTLLFQAVFEQSLNAGCEGRISLFSANKTGGFYFNLGLTALKESIFDALYYEGQKEVDGGIMFLTDSAIDAWQERAKAQPLLKNTTLIEDNKVNTKVFQT